MACPAGAGRPIVGRSGADGLCVEQLPRLLALGWRPPPLRLMQRPPGGLGADRPPSSGAAAAKRRCCDAILVSTKRPAFVIGCSSIRSQKLPARLLPATLPGQPQAVRPGLAERPRRRSAMPLNPDWECFLRLCRFGLCIGADVETLLRSSGRSGLGDEGGDDSKYGARRRSRPRRWKGGARASPRRAKRDGRRTGGRAGNVGGSC